MVALLIARNLIVEFRIKLKSIGVTLIVPTDFYFDNQVVVNNTSVPEYKLNKKHNYINYSVVHELAAAVILHVGK